MKFLKPGLFISLQLALLISSQGLAKDQGYSIIKKSLELDEGFKDNVVKAQMTLRDKSGQSSVRQFTVKTLEGADEEDKTILTFEAPKDIKGTALLTHNKKNSDNLQWLYLPTIRRVKRISTGNKSGPFVGSEFAFEDLVSHQLEKYSYKKVADSVANGISCYVVEQTPKDKSSGYAKQIVWIDKSEHRLQKVHYFDKKLAHFKTLELSGYKKFKKKFWRPAKSEMTNLVSGKSTIIAWTEYKFGQNLKDRSFTKAALKR
ncbi:outer membrane lipoprotein-sorting protein [Oligoflexaceae bacterium]|nr:outer membrane lipoprotein-sorting protein [Oligoflexaceae bacterium]